MVALRSDIIQGTFPHVGMTLEMLRIEYMTYLDVQNPLNAKSATFAQKVSQSGFQLDFGNLAEVKSGLLFNSSEF